MRSLAAWYATRKRGTKFLLAAGGVVASLAVLYTAARAVQYAGASRTPAGLFVPEGAEVVIRVSDLAGRWRDVQESELWKSFKRRLQKDPAIRKSLNDILKSAGAPTLDELEDRRWLDRNSLMQESSILRYAGRDLVFSSIGSKYCVATRLGLGDFLLLPGLQLFPAVAGAESADVGGATVLKRGDLFIAIQGAIVVTSNDAQLLGSALQRPGTPETPDGLVRATLGPGPLLPVLGGFPLGALFTFADLETCRRLEIDVEVDGADLVVRAKADGLKARRSDPAPADTVRLIPANGIGGCITNVNGAPLWEWARQLDRRVRGGTEADKYARENLGEFVEILFSQGFGEEVVPKLDGPVGVLFGASEGDDGRTYAAIALVLRSSQPRDAKDSLQGVIDRATVRIKKEFRPTDDEAGGIDYRGYRFDPDPFRANNYMAVSYAATGDALILANNRGFLADVLRCRANQESVMARQLHFTQAMERLQELGMEKVMASGATASLFLYGPAIRQGLEGFYGTVASRLVDTPKAKADLRQELETEAAKEGHPVKPDDLDRQVRRVLDERIQTMDERLRANARILDYLKWVAFQAETVADGMQIEFAIELK